MRTVCVNPMTIEDFTKNVLGDGLFYEFNIGIRVNDDDGHWVYYIDNSLWIYGGGGCAIADRYKYKISAYEVFGVDRANYLELEGVWDRI